MALDILNGSGPLRVVKVLANGKRRFDPVEKDRLITAAMKPGVSVARLALAHGVNANQLRNWVKLRRDQQAQGALTVVAERETSAFVPVVAASPIARQSDMPARPSSAGMRLTASLPNGVRLELEDADEQAVSVMIEALGRYNVPAG
ncbi:IS66-like element accessory protein TnpA [Rhizobium mongolense]|uniref:Transposase n=1 Tax=Rhizobium mongolense TaxID=57676 RepID=A0A7W6RQ86_9HYPH|nr:transposase [Rhizobium mongolense]MBB4276669.1 transposase [Rhizobium mongolense]